MVGGHWAESEGSPQVSLPPSSHRSLELIYLSPAPGINWTDKLQWLADTDNHCQYLSAISQMCSDSTQHLESLLLSSGWHTNSQGGTVEEAARSCGLQDRAGL